MTVKSIIEQIRPILTQFDVIKAGVFGSYATGKKNESSDLDLLVEMSAEKSLTDFISLKHAIEDSLGVNVDLVEYSTIKKILLEKILSEEIRIYEKGRKN